MRRSLWALSIGKTEKKIQRVRNYYVRFWYAVPARSHLTPFLNYFGLLNMSNRRRLKLNSILFNLRHCGVSQYLANKLCWNYRVKDQTPWIQYPVLPLRSFPRLHFRLPFTKCWNDLSPPTKHYHSLYTLKKSADNDCLTSKNLNVVGINCIRITLNCS